MDRFDNDRGNPSSIQAGHKRRVGAERAKGVPNTAEEGGGYPVAEEEGVSIRVNHIK